MNGNRIKLKLKTIPGRRNSDTENSRDNANPVCKHNDTVLRILVLMAIFAVAYYGITAEWPQLENIDARGGINIGEQELIALAGLDDFDDAWTMFIPVEEISSSLEANPLIEHAEVSMTGLKSIRIRITERRPITAVEHKGFRFLIDRTGELIDIQSPYTLCAYPIVRGVPPGLLKLNGEPFYRRGGIWRLPAGVEDEKWELQFGRLIHLQRLLNRDNTDRENKLAGIVMDEIGHIIVEYDNCPPIILGNFKNPELQFSQMLAVLANDEITNPERTIDIDLSSELFPCYHVREDFYTQEERAAIDLWKQEQVEDDDSESEDEDTATGDESEPDDDTQEAIRDNSIFNLAGGVTSDDDNQQ